MRPSGRRAIACASLTLGLPGEILAVVEARRAGLVLEPESLAWAMPAARPAAARAASNYGGLSHGASVEVAGDAQRTSGCLNAA